MLTFIHYISASRRLKELQKTVDMLGGESEAPPMVLGQRDICHLEKEYYLEQSYKAIWLYFVSAIFLVVAYALYRMTHVK